MSKNRFAQPLYGKIIYIFETDLAFDQLSTVFSPTTYWIDVTGIDCEVGYLVEFKEGVGLVLTPPPNKELTLDELKAQKLELIDALTAKKITNGFVSECTGFPVMYDSDKDTQLTMQGVALNVDHEAFTEKYPQGCPVRGYVMNKDKFGELIAEPVKTVLFFSAEQILLWQADLSMHIGECKQKGWQKQAEVNACKTKEELEQVDIVI